MELFDSSELSAFGTPAHRPEYLIEYSSLEAILRGVGAFEDTYLCKLIKERAGIDLRWPTRLYSFDKVHRAVQVIRDLRYPDCTEREALIEIGRASMFGYSQTIIGRILCAPLSIQLDPERSLHLLLRLYNAGVQFGERSLVKNGPANFVFRFRDEPGSPYFAYGVLKGFLERINLNQAQVAVVIIGPRAFDLEVSW